MPRYIIVPLIITEEKNGFIAHGYIQIEYRVALPNFRLQCVNTINLYRILCSSLVIVSIETTALNFIF